MDFDELDYEEMTEEEYIDMQITKAEFEYDFEKEERWNNENVEETE